MKNFRSRLGFASKKLQLFARLQNYVHQVLIRIKLQRCENVLVHFSCRFGISRKKNSSLIETLHVFNS